MRKLALSDEILLTVEKPARYIGNEINAVYKDPEQVDVRFAMCFPDVYEIGMSHLGIQILYHMLNAMEHVWCERVYSPWVDLDRVMREQKIPLFALESQSPVREFDFLGITIQYEMCYTNILQILDLSGIPMMASERGEDDPIVIGGGPCTYNPEPLADFFDMFYIGEGEETYPELIRLYREHKAAGGHREAFLQKAATLPGIYVPSLYEVTYHADGTLASFTPKYPDVPEKVRKVIVKDMTESFYPEKPLVPFIKVTQDRVVLEIQRGCIRGCRFCQAGMVYRPVRERSLDRLQDLAAKMLENSGHEEISLSSLSSSDYSGIEPLVNGLIEDCRNRKVNISLPSLRIDAFSLDVMSKVQDVKKSSLTFAPEAGTQRLRNVINKGLTEENILNGAAEAFRGGWSKVKLYFMLGLPTRPEEDMKGDSASCLRRSRAVLYHEEVPKEKRHGKGEYHSERVFLCSETLYAVPVGNDVSEGRVSAPGIPGERYLRGAAQSQGRCISSIMRHVTVLEGVLARGDRKVAASILQAYRRGCLYDAWSDFFDNDKWMQAFADTGVDPDFYTLRERTAEELFPWDFIDVGVTKKFLRREWERAMAAEVTRIAAMCATAAERTFGTGICPGGDRDRLCAKGGEE